MTSSETSVAVIVPTYNTMEMTIACIEHLLNGDVRPSSVVVVDNGTDGTDITVRELFEDVTVVAPASNLGFAAAINRGAALTAAPYILWLNSDVMLGPKDLASLLDEMGVEGSLAAVGPRQVNLDGVLLPATHPYPSAVRPFRRRKKGYGAERPSDDEFLSGACLLVSREAWLDVGPLDEAFFFYWEEADWQYRARKKGWTTRLGETTVRHLGGGSADGRSTVLQLLSSEGYERFIAKHEGHAAFVLHRATNLPGVIRSALASRLTRGSSGSDGPDPARARLRQIARRIPASGESPWANQLRGQR